jgi:IQBAL scaffold dimerization domain
MYVEPLHIRCEPGVPQWRWTYCRVAFVASWRKQYSQFSALQEVYVGRCESLATTQWILGGNDICLTQLYLCLLRSLTFPFPTIFNVHYAHLHSQILLSLDVDELFHHMPRFLMCRQMMVCKSDVDSLQQKSQQLLDKMSSVKDEVMRYQRQRQKDVWNLLSKIAMKVCQ